MKRDLNLIKAILLDIQDRYPKDFYPTADRYGVSQDELDLHCSLIGGHRLALGEYSCPMITTCSCGNYWKFTELTWDGYDFLDEHEEFPDIRKPLPVGEETDVPTE